MALARLNWFLTFVIGLIGAVGVAPPALSGPGDLDVRFGTHGQTEVPGQVDSASLIPLPDGRILVFGVPENVAARTAGAIGVARLLANGKPDETFAPGGHIDLRLGSDPVPVPTDALLLDNGQVLVAGYFGVSKSTASPPDRRLIQGWLVRLSSDGAIDPAFGIGGVARIGQRGVDRIALLADGAIAAAAPGRLHRLEPVGAPAFFPGSETSSVTLGSGLNVSSMLAMPDGSTVISSGFWDGWDNYSSFDRISASGERSAALNSNNAVYEVASFAPDSDSSRLLACGHGYSRERGEALIVERWQNDGKLDPAFAPGTSGRVEVGVDTRPGFDYWRLPRCRALLRDSAGGYLVVGDWSRLFEYGGGRLLFVLFDVSGAMDMTFDGTGHGREVAVGVSGDWSNWYAPDAALAADGAVLVLARRAGDPHTLISRLEVRPSQGVGSIGFTDAAVRVAERRPRDLRVHRSGGSTGQISVRYEVLYETADSADVAPTAGTLTWATGDTTARVIPLVPVDDAAMEGEESFRVRLSEPTGGAGLGVPEIEVIIEDDEALRALQFAESAIQVAEGQNRELTITRPAATRGSIVVRYALAADLDPADGTPRPGTHTRYANYGVGELRWSNDDTSNRVLSVRALNTGNAPDATIYVALADVSGTLPDGDDWKTAHITVTDRVTPSPPPAPRTPATSPPARGGGGAISLSLLLFLALASLLNYSVRSDRPAGRSAKGS